MTNNLPPGPLTVNQFDSVYDATGRFVASLDGHRTLAELLIRAEREADPTPIDVAWLVSVGGEIVKNLDYLISVAFKITGKSDISVVWCPDDRRSIQELSYGLFYKIPVPTRGTFRTAMRLLGIKIEETA